MKRITFTGLLLSVAVGWAIGMNEIISLAQDPTAAPHASLKIRTEHGWVEMSAPTGAAFVVDGTNVQVEGVATDAMSVERTADGFSLVCNGWTYRTDGPFSMSKDGKALVVGGATATPPAADETDLPANPIKVAGESPDVKPVSPAKEPAAARPKGN